MTGTDQRLDALESLARDMALKLSMIECFCRGDKISLCFGDLGAQIKEIHNVIDEVKDGIACFEKDIDSLRHDINILRKQHENKDN